MRARPTPVLLLVAAATLVSAGAVVHAQDADDDLAGKIDHALLAAQSGEEATEDELEAWRLAERGRHIKAREVAERVVEANPRSYVGHFVLGFVQHYAEANFPKALYELERALGLFEAEYGAEPDTAGPWRWHARILRELAFTHGDLEHHAEKVRFMERYNELYEPDMLAEQAWPLMKMGQYEAARLAARRGLEDGSPRQLEVAYNALCAIEFEAGNDGESYEHCKRALDYGRTQPEGPNAVDLSNFSEAARSLFKLDEAERVSLEATEADPAWYANPWIELAELYTREGRYPEALQALEEVPKYRAKRPPHVRDSDQNEGRRALSAFYVVVGRPEEAIRITEKALLYPDRRAHNSRDPNQDQAIAALLDRRARRMQAQRILEEAAAEAFWEYPWHALRAGWLRFEGWLSGRQAARLLADDERLVGTFRIGTSKSAIMPPWLAGELVEVAGAGVVEEAVTRAREADGREEADAYYDAFAAEAALRSGDDERASELAGRALAALNPAEALLRARMQAIDAEAKRRLGELDAALRRYEQAFQTDPGVFRRLDLEVPAKIEVSGDEVAEDVADAIAWSPRFADEDVGLTVRIDATAARGEVCLLGVTGARLGCVQEVPEQQETPEEFAQLLADGFHRLAFAPRVDLTQADIGSLDGTNTTGRDPLDDLLAE